MNTLIHADLFFLITTIAVVVITFCIIGISLYICRVIHRFHSILERIDRGIADTGVELTELIAQITDSALFSLFFPRRRNKTRTQKEKNEKHYQLIVRNN